MLFTWVSWISLAPLSVYLIARPAPGGINLAVVAVHNDGDQNYGMVKRELLFLSGRRVEDGLRTEWGKPTVPEPASAISHKDDEWFYTTGYRFYRIVVNGILYIGSSAPDITGRLRARDQIAEEFEKKSLARIQRLIDERAERCSKLRYTIVGKNTRPFDFATQGGSGRPLAERKKVRGHWKHQAHGPQHSQRKYIHIAP